MGRYREVKDSVAALKEENARLRKALREARAKIKELEGPPAAAAPSE